MSENSPNQLSPKEMAVLDLIQRDVPARELFFKRIKRTKWFFPIKELGLFDATQAPGPIPAEDPGYFKVPYWSVLGYLEHISTLHDDVQFDLIVPWLLKIIRDVSNRRNEDGLPIANYHTWTSFTKILVNLPCKLVPLDIIEQIPVWLQSPFTFDFTGHEVATELYPKFVLDKSPGSDEKAQIVLRHLTQVKKVGSKSELTDRFQTVVRQYSLLELFCSEKYEAIRNALDYQSIFIVADALRDIIRKQRYVQREFENNSQVFRVTLRWCEDQKVSCSIERLDAKSPTQTIESWFLETPIERPMVLEVETQIIAAPETPEHLAMLIREGQWNSPQIIEFVNSLDEGELTRSYYALSQDLSYIWFTSLLEYDRAVHDAEAVFVAILKSLLATKSATDEKELAVVLSRFLTNEYPYAIFRRLVIYLLAGPFSSQAFHDLRSQLFKSWLNPWIDDIHYERELVYLLEENASALTSEELIKLDRSIASYTWEGATDLQIAFWKQRWYASLKVLAPFAGLHNKMKSITNTEERPSYYTESYEGRGQTPYNITEIAAFSDDEFVSKVLEFQGSPRWSGPTLNALAEELEKLAASDPTAMTRRLPVFKQKPIAFIHAYHILRGLESASKASIPIDWQAVLGFVEDYCAQAGFWNDDYFVASDEWQAKHGWIIAVVAGLVRSLTEIDSGNESYQRSFPSSLNLRVRDLLLEFSKRLGNEESSSTSALDRLYNSTRGKVVLALEGLSLKMKHDEPDMSWDDSIRSEFTRLIAEKSPEMLTVVGFKYRNLLHLDKDWVETTIERFMSLDDSSWSHFIQGYFCHIARPGLELYRRLLPHYSRVMQVDNLPSDIEDRWVAHLAHEYLEDLLPESESMFFRMLKRWKPANIEALIDFFHLNSTPWRSALERRVPPPDSEYLRKFAAKAIGVFQIIKDHYDSDTVLTKADKELFGHSVLLLPYLPQIDANTADLINFCTTSRSHTFNEAFFFETLNHLRYRRLDHAHEVASLIAQILTALLDSGRYPTYPKEEITEVVEFVFSNGDPNTKRLASRICSRMGEAHIDYLRELYDRYRDC